MSWITALFSFLLINQFQTSLLLQHRIQNQCHGDHCDSKIRIDQTGSDFYNQLLAPITVIGFNPHDTWFKLELNIKKPCRNLRTRLKMVLETDDIAHHIFVDISTLRENVDKGILSLVYTSNNSVVAESLPVKQCSLYDLYVTLDNSDCPSTKPIGQRFRTLPAPGTTVLIESVGSDEDQLSISWRLSENKCLPILSQNSLIISNSDRTYVSQRWFNPPKMNRKGRVEEVVKFNVDWDQLSLSPCTDYSFQISSVFYAGYGRSELYSQPQKLPISVQNVATLITSVSNGRDWISFKWGFSVVKCSQYLSGFTVEMVDIDNPYEVLIWNQSLKYAKKMMAFNTSQTDWDVSSCTDYSFKITPEFHNGYRVTGAPSLPSNRTLVPDAVAENDILVDFSASSISWIAPKPNTCIDGYIVDIVEGRSGKTVFDEIVTEDVIQVMLEEDDIYVLSITAFIDDVDGIRWNSSTTSKIFVWKLANDMVNEMAIISCSIVGVIMVLVLVAFIRKYYSDVICYETTQRPRALSATETEVKMDTMKHSLSEQEFQQRLVSIQADSCYELSCEFESIQQKSMELDRLYQQRIGQWPENRIKNRYTNIIPYDHSRVKLVSAVSDYINASYIRGYGNDVSYIASQGPTSTTLPDFWLMVWQHNVNVIVMLTSLVEKGRVKCEQYWPSSATADYGDLSVSLVDEAHHVFYTVRHLLLRPRLSECAGKEIRQLHFTAWPDFECPDNPQQLIDFVHIVRTESRLLATDNPYLVITHCSAGVGRTGTLIALDMLMHQVSNKRNIDVFGTVLDIRKDRYLMVQSEEQYLFLYQCVWQYIQNYNEITK